MKGIWKASVQKWHKDSRRKRTSRRQFFKNNQNFYKKGKLIGIYNVEEKVFEKVSGKVKILIKEIDTIPIEKLINIKYTYKTKLFEYILFKKFGNYGDLTEKFGKKIVDSVLKARLIKSEGSLNLFWKITPEGKSFFEKVIPKRDFTFLERIQNKINDLISNNAIKF